MEVWTVRAKKNMVFAIMLFMVSNFAVRGLGLLREILIANYYGTSELTDAYIIANNIPSVLFAALGSAIAATFVPMYTKVCSECGESRANQFTVHIIEALLVICSIFVLFGEVFTKQVVLLFASGFKGSLLSLTVCFSRILFPSLFFMSLFDLAGSYMQQHEEFKTIAIVPAIGNGTIIIALLVSDIFSNIYIFVWGTLLGLALQVIFYIPWLLKHGMFGHNENNIQGGHFYKDQYLRELMPMLVPVFIGAGATEINSMVDKSLASTLGAGYISALNYSYKIINLFVGIIVASITVVAFPKIAKDAGTVNFSKTNNNVINGMAIIIIPVSILLIMLRENIISILFLRGNFNSASLVITSSSLAFYAVGLPFIGIRDVLLKVCYSVQNTKISMANGIITTTLNILLDFILIHKFKQDGLAFATSLSIIASTMVLAWTLNKNKWIVASNSIKTLGQAIFAAFTSYVVTDIASSTKELTAICGNSDIIEILLVGFLFVFVYFIIMIIISKNVRSLIKFNTI